MPFQSEKQKKWMWANKPEMAREWTQEYGSKVKAKTGTMTKKDDNWIQKATKNMRKDKPCTGDKFGGPTCPKGSRRYNLAKTFKKMAKKAGGGPIKAQDSKFIQKKKWWANPKKLKDLTTKLKSDLQFISDAKAGKLSPALAEKAKKKILTKTPINVEDTRSWQKTLKDIGQEAKGGQGFTPGWKPQLSVRTAKKGTFNRTDIGRLLDQMKVRHKGGLPKAKGYKKHLKALGKMQKAPLSGISKTLPPKTARLLGQLKFAYKDRSKARALLPAAKALGKRTGIGKILLGAGAVAGAYEAGKKKLFSKKKVQKKSTGGEIIIGRGVDLDLL
jgi:hypothetical protein